MERKRLPEGPKEFKFTKAAIDGLPPTEGGQRIHWDSVQPGFGVIVGKNKKKKHTYFCQRNLRGSDRTVRVTIGHHPAWTPELARLKAQDYIVQLSNGINPNEEKQKAKAKAKLAAKAKEITLQAMLDQFLAARSIKANTIRQYKCLVMDVFGKWLSKPVTEITRDMVLDRHLLLRSKSPAYANQAMRVLSAIMNFCMAQTGPDGNELITANPVQIIKQTKAWAKLNRRTTLVRDDDLARWLKAVNDLRYSTDIPSAEVGADYVEVVLFTGLRRNEAASLKLSYIDFPRKLLRVPMTKNGRPHELPLTDHLITILERRKVAAEGRGSEWVFPSAGLNEGEGHIAEPRFILDAIKTRCQIGVTVHDLRRTFATTAQAKLKIDSLTLKRLLNHSTTSDVTAGYVVPDVEDLRQAMDHITGYLLAKRATGQSLKLA